MGVKCRISYDNRGNVQVLDSKGNESESFKNILALTGNQKTALDFWVIASDNHLMNNEDASFEEIMAFLDADSSTDKKLSPGEKIQVTDFMARNGVNTLDELNSQLAKIFKPNGILEIDIDEAIDSGLFTADEIGNIDLDKLQDIMLKIEGQLAIDDISIEPLVSETKYIDNDRSTIFGTKQRVTQEELDQDIVRAVDNFKDKNEFTRGVMTLPYTEFVDKFLNDKAFAESIMDKFSGLKKIPALSIVDGKLSDKNNTVYTTVKNTVLQNVDGVSILADIEYLNDIPQDVWEQSEEDIEEVLKEVEQELIKVNIDVIGIHEYQGSRQKVMDLLMKAYILTQQASPSTIQAFADSHAAIFETPGKIVAEKLDERYTGLNIVSLHSNMNENTLFEKYGLIRIADNLYHKVDQSADFNLVKDAIYEGVKRGSIEIPRGFITEDINDILNKPAILEGISRYLMSRPTPVNHANHELYSGYQVAFNHAPVQVNRNDIRGLTELKTDEEYLKGEFISDFYNYILREKFNKTATYDSVLSKFEINDKDITLTSKIDSIDNLEYSKELADYIRLHKDSNMKYLVDDSSTAISEDLYAINFPETVAEYKGDMVKEGDFIITPPTVGSYIKLDGKLYRKEASKIDADLFVRITTTQNPTYYLSSQNFDFNREQGVNLLNAFNLLDQYAVSYQDFLTILAKSRIGDDMSPSLKELSTLKDKSYVFVENYGFISAIKDGVEIGRAEFRIKPDTYENPVVRVNEKHRGKGIGTELFLHVFDKAWKSGRSVGEPSIETKQSLNIFSRVKGIEEINRDATKLQQGNNEQSSTTPKVVVDAVLSKLKETGLAENVYSMTSSEIESKLNELGIRPSISKQVTVWHGTSNPMKDIKVIDKRNEKRYGQLLGGTYFASKDVASWFSGWIENQSKMIKANIDESSFAVIDMKGNIPNDRIDIIRDGVLTEEEYEELLNKKKSGAIKGLILENAKEDDISHLHTQYLVFSPDVIEKVEEVTDYQEIGRAMGMVKDEVSLQLQSEGITVTPNGFVHNGDVYLNTDSANLLNTQIHEFGHLFNSWAKANRPDIYKRGLELIQNEAGKPYVDFVKRNQPNLKGEKLFEEALTQAIGDKGQRIVEESAKESFIQWLSDLWDSIKNALGITDVTSEQLQNMNLDQFARAVAADMMKGRVYQTNPYTIQVMMDPMIAGKEGKMVNVQTIQQILKQQSTKKIEKDIINEVLELEGFKGKSKIPFDEFKAEVNMRVMPLTVVPSTSYSDYGSGNVGVEVSTSVTNIYNTDLDHQMTGHFPADFKQINRDDLEVRYIPEHSTWVVVRRGVQLTQENIPDNVFHASPSEESAMVWVENYEMKTLNQGMFGHTRVWTDAEYRDVYVAEVQSDSYQKAKAEDMLFTAYERNPEKLEGKHKEAYDKYVSITETLNRYEDSSDKRIPELYGDIRDTIDQINRTKRTLEDHDRGRGSEFIVRDAIVSQIKASQGVLDNLVKLAKGEKITLKETPDVFDTIKKSKTWFLPYNTIEAIERGVVITDKKSNKSVNIFDVLGKIYVHTDGLLSGYNSERIEEEVIDKGFNSTPIKSFEKLSSATDLEKLASYDKEELNRYIFKTKEALERVRNNRDYENILSNQELARYFEELKNRYPNKDVIGDFMAAYRIVSDPKREENYSFEPGYQYSLATMKDLKFDTLEEAFDHYKEKTLPNVEVNPSDYLEYFNARKDIDKARKDVIEQAPIKDQQFIAHRKNYSDRLLREEIRRSALNGMKTLSIPTPRTLSLIEGYVSEGMNGIPYEILDSQKEDFLELGDTINYLDTEYIVVESYSDEIGIVEKDRGNIVDVNKYIEGLINSEIKDSIYGFKQAMEGETTLEFTEGEWRNFVKSNELIFLYDMEAQHFSESEMEDEQGNTVYTISRELVENQATKNANERFEYDSFELGDYFTTAHKLGGDSLFVSEQKLYVEFLKQPDQYEEVSEEDFDISNMSDTEQTILRKYEDLIENFKKIRPDAEMVQDSKGNYWIRTELTEEDADKPVIAFQVGETTNLQENIENISSIFDSRLELLDLYSSSEEVTINEKIDCGG